MQKVVLSWHPSDLAFVLSLSSLKTLIWTSSNSVITGCFQASLKVFELVSPLPPTCADASSARAPSQLQPFFPVFTVKLLDRVTRTHLRFISSMPCSAHSALPSALGAAQNRQAPTTRQISKHASVSALVRWGCRTGAQQTGGAYEQQVFISHSSGGRKPEIGVSEWSGSARSPVWGCRRQLLVDGDLALWRPITGAPPTHLPKAPPPEQSQWGVDFDL